MNTCTLEPRTNSFNNSVNWTGPAESLSVSTEVDRQRALHAIYEAHVERIYSFVLYKVGSPERAEDITSEVFIKAAQFLDVTQDERARLSWLYQVARTTITDHWRAFYKHPSTSLEQMEEVGQFQVAEASILGNPSNADLSGAVTKLNVVLSSLPEKYRQVLELRFLLGYSLKETAQAMGITQGNVKVLQHRALNKAAVAGASVM